ncbi:MAG TPA: hypothetical protein PKY82_22665 [Pyrinomonadaceae bacterium]|nr:hypothetical protein [Pyrinomonadaceae bacterium]
MSENHKDIKSVYCLGRLPNLSRCAELIYESDGEFMYIRAMSGNLYRINERLDIQRVRCPICGYQMIWKRAERYRNAKVKSNSEIIRQFKAKY